MITANLLSQISNNSTIVEPISVDVSAQMTEEKTNELLNRFKELAEEGFGGVIISLGIKTIFDDKINHLEETFDDEIILETLNRLEFKVHKLSQSMIGFFNYRIVWNDNLPINEYVIN